MAFNILMMAALVAASPSPSPTPSAPSDPCGSIISIVNRPPITTGVCTVRTFDIETGYQNTVTTGTGGGNTAAYGPTLIRVGTKNPHLDFELTPPSAIASSLGGATANGWSDLALGAKAELGYSAKWLWGVAGQVSLPTGSQAFTAGHAQYVGSFNWNYTVNPVIGLSGMIAYNALWGANASGSLAAYSSFEPTLDVSATLPGPPALLYVEYAYLSAAGPGFGSKSIYDVGYARAIGPHIQFDVEYGFSPTPIGGQRQHYVGAGLSFMR